MAQWLAEVRRLAQPIVRSTDYALYQGIEQSHKPHHAVCREYRRHHRVRPTKDPGLLQRLLANSVATTAQYRLGPVGDPREFMYLGTVKV